MKKGLYILFVLLVFVSGCTTSILLVKSKIDHNAYSMFGKNPQRNFYVPIEFNVNIKLKWKSNTRGAFPNSSVTISDSIVFINDLYGRVYAFNFFNGEKYGEIKNKGAVFTTPVVSGLWIVFVVSMEQDDMSKFVMYDFTNAKPFREVDVEGRVQTEILKLSDGFVITTLNGKVIKYDKFGIFLWETNTNVNTRSNPAFLNNKIILGNDKGEIIALNNNDGKILYHKKIGGKFWSGSIISDGKIFIGDTNGKLYCLDINSAKIIWEYDTGAKILMTPVADDSNIYIGNLAGKFYSIDKNSGQKKWDIKTDGLFNTTPLVTKNILIAPDFNKKILFIDKRKGTIQKTMELNGRAKLSPVIFKNTLFIGYDRGKLEAYEISN
ncbi:MAG: PQQ-binding-like beta-propeller repeat protein [Bacteroidetes bacterium]|nr:PQQ-binding-like beta-propeller repeat protein [Bacteroidota bacterium]